MMQVSGLARRWAAILVIAQTTVALATGVLTIGWAGDAWAGWPNADPAQPLVQAPRVCASGIVPLNRRCHVVDFAPVGSFDGRDWYYAFYATHWADRHGKMDRGFPVIFYLQRPATLRLSLWVDDAPGLAGRWARKAPPRPVLIQRPGGTYLGFSLKAVRGPDDQRLFRLDGRHWRPLNVLRRSNADEAMISGATPADCSTVDDGLYDWTAFQLRIALRKDAGGSCGTLLADMKPHRNHLDLTKVTVAR